MKSDTPKMRSLQRFGLPVLMCVDYISALKEATSYKFLFNGFLSIKYSAKAVFSSLRYFCPDVYFLLFINMLFFCERAYERARSRDCATAA
jgi:hypothetical protein